MTELKAGNNPQVDEGESLDIEFGDPKLMGGGDEGSESVEQNVADLKRLLGEARQRLTSIEKAVRNAE